MCIRVENWVRQKLHKNVHFLEKGMLLQPTWSRMGKCTKHAGVLELQFFFSAKIFQDAGKKLSLPSAVSLSWEGAKIWSIPETVLMIATLSVKKRKILSINREKRRGKQLTQLFQIQYLFRLLASFCHSVSAHFWLAVSDLWLAVEACFSKADAKYRYCLPVKHWPYIFGRHACLRMVV